MLCSQGSAHRFDIDSYAIGLHSLACFHSKYLFFELAYASKYAFPANQLYKSHMQISWT